MREKKQAFLTMKKILRAGEKPDEKTYVCSVVDYKEKTECLYLLLQEGSLTDLSLDAVYECRIMEADCEIQSTGRIRARYFCEHGKMLEMRIENGFYKNNIKSVDKR